MSALLSLPQLWASSTLGQELMRCEERIDPGSTPNEKYFYVGLENIVSHTGELVGAPISDSSEIKSAKNVFHKGDILYGRLRPNLNKVYLAERDGICSTDIWVFRTTDTIDVDYATYYLRAHHVLQRVSAWATGANLPRIDSATFDSILIPLPPLSEQRRIVDILHKADELRRKRREAQREAQSLLPALFEEMFGNPRTNPKGWDEVPLSQHISFITSGSRGWAQYYASGGAKFIRVQNLTGHVLDTSDMAFVQPPNSVESDRAKIQPNDLLFSITGVVGLVAVAPDDIGEAYVSQHVAIIRLDQEVNPVFVAAFLAHKLGGQERIRRAQYGQVKPGFGLEDIRSLRILRPPKELQDEYVLRAQKAHSLHANHLESLHDLESLFSSLLARSFSGELTVTWRGRHHEQLATEAAQRDQLLAERGVAQRQIISQMPLVETLEGNAPAIVPRGPRDEFIACLSEQQREIWQAVQEHDGYLNAETLSQSYDFPLARTRQTLELLASSGLLLPVSLWNSEINDFVVAYRRLHLGSDDVGRSDESYADDMMLLRPQ